MPKSLLQIVEGAYRITLEEQDDPAVWLAGAMQAAGAHLAVLLRGNAVNYAVRDQDAAGFAVGAWRQTQPPRVDADLTRLVGKGVAVYIVEEDVAERGLERGALIAGLTPVARAGLPALLAKFDQVWHW